MARIEDDVIRFGFQCPDGIGVSIDGQYVPLDARQGRLVLVPDPSIVDNERFAEAVAWCRRFIGPYAGWDWARKRLIANGVDPSDL